MMTMKQGILSALGFCIILVLAGQVSGDDLVAFPAKGQSPEQMEKDKSACYSWAKNQTGFDPMSTPQATTPPPQQAVPKGGVARGAARGALVGVAVGAIAGDAGKGAAIGAASGGLFGGMRRRDQVRQEQHAQDKWAQEQAANYSKKRKTYNRAYGACLEGKGYTVK